MLYSVVIPCYRSDQTIEHVVDQTREEMVRLGGIKAEEARNHPDKNIITRAIGVKEETENYSSTALQTACASQSQEILKYLKKHGGDSKKKDSEGRSCKKIAKDNKAVWNLELIQ